MTTTATAAPTGAYAIMPQLAGLYAIWLREVKRAIRDRGQLIGGVSRPLLWVLIMGIGLNPYFRGEIYGEVRFVVPYTYLQFIFPAVIVLNIMYTSVQSAVSTIWDREFGFLREILVSPLSRTTILLGKILGGATVALFHGCLVLVLARFADISLNPVDILYGLLLMFLLAFGLTSLGVVIANRVQQLRGLRRLLQRRHPAALFHVELDLPARSLAHQRAEQDRLSGMAGDARRDQSAHLCGRRVARHIHSFSSVRSETRTDRARRHGGHLLPDRAARLQKALMR